MTGPGSSHSSSPPQVKRISGRYFPKFLPKTLFSFLTFFWFLTLPLWRGWLVCVWRVCSSVCEGSGVVLFALRESLKVVTEGEKFSPRWMFSCCSCWPWLALSVPSHMQVSEPSAITVLLLAHCVPSLPLPPCAQTTPLFVCFNPCWLNNNSLEAVFRM